MSFGSGLACVAADDCDQRPARPEHEYDTERDGHT